MLESIECRNTSEEIFSEILERDQRPCLYIVERVKVGKCLWCVRGTASKSYHFSVRRCPHCYLQKGIQVQSSGLAHSRIHNLRGWNVLSVKSVNPIVNRTSLLNSISYPWKRSVNEWLDFHLWKCVKSECCTNFLARKSRCSFDVRVIGGFQATADEPVQLLYEQGSHPVPRRAELFPAVSQRVCLGWSLVAHH